MSELDQLKAELSKFCQLAYHRRLVCASGGNISVRVDNSNTFLISASGVSLRDVVPENIITVDAAGAKISGPTELKPSKESILHTNVYSHKPGANAVVHVHPPHCIGLSICGRCIPLVTVSSELKLGPTPLIAKAYPGSKELAEYVKEKVQQIGPEVNTLLLGRHGIVSFGPSLVEAFNAADLAEETAQITFIAENLSPHLG